MVKLKMVSFFVYDITFLIAFTIFVVWFLYTRRSNLKREGILYLYRTQLGMKLIDKVGRKYKKTLHFLSYISVALGYLLMFGIIYLFAQIIYLYAAFPGIVRAIKVPPITPLIPYLPSIFKLDFLPPFYFTYWILILAIVAITHEFAHGIFARLYDVKIKSTGFGFLGPFLAAFVELDEPKMEKKQKFKQLSILSAGTFANVLTAILFFFVIWGFFTMSFTAAGVEFDTYSYSLVEFGAITSINNNAVYGATYNDILNSLDEKNESKIKVQEREFIAQKELIESQAETKDFIVLYDDAPAINSELNGAIIEINGEKIDSTEKLGEELEKYSPEDRITIKTINSENEIKETQITLGEKPNEAGKPWLGIGFIENQRSGLLSKAYFALSSFKEPHVYYQPKNNLSIFIYNLLWWVILISISVALVNMLPVGIFDGGRFFYLTALYFVKDPKTAKKIFSWSTYLFLFLILLLMIFWAVSFF